MSGMTESEILDRLQGYLAAEKAILAGAQEYTIGQGSTARRVVRAELEQIRAGIAECRAELAIVQAPVRRGAFYLRPYN